MKNISNIHNCYGCGVCSVVCAKKIIEIRQNSDGFYEPFITDLSKCTNCGLCLDICAYSHHELANVPTEILSYASWSKEEAVRKKCSSGGVGFEIGRHLLNQGYKVCGVRYNADKNQAEHYIAQTIEELIPSIGSKYIQSYTVDGFGAINRKEKYLVTGTPCQIDSFRRYIKKFKVEDNFILMDFFCHGVPSKLLWDKYLKSVEKTTGKVTYVSWRNKITGWQDSWAMAIDGEASSGKVPSNNCYSLLMKESKCFYNSRMSKGDNFYALFFGNNCLGKACYKDCKYKNINSSADIRIGDLWGKTYKDNAEGVSALLSLTSKGKELIQSIKAIDLVSHEVDVVVEGQMKHKLKYPSIARWSILTLAKCGASLSILVFTTRVFSKLRRMFG